MLATSGEKEESGKLKRGLCAAPFPVANALIYWIRRLLFDETEATCTNRYSMPLRVFEQMEKKHTNKWKWEQSKFVYILRHDLPKLKYFSGFFVGVKQFRLWHWRHFSFSRRCSSPFKGYRTESSANSNTNVTNCLVTVIFFSKLYFLGRRNLHREYPIDVIVINVY